MGKYVSVGMLDIISSVSKDRVDVINELDGRDDWAVTDKDILNRVNGILKNLDKIVKRSDGGKDSIVKIMAMIKTGNMINLSDFIKKKNEYYYISQLLDLINKCDDEYSKIIVRRFLTLYRVAVIPKIFSDERLDAIHEQIKMKNNLNNN